MAANDLNAIGVGPDRVLVGGGLYLFGNPHAGRILFGVIVGLGLILPAPSTVA